VLARPEEELQGLSVTKPAASLRVLLTDLIDYAGLFPPAALDMKSAVANYARYLRSEHAWMLGRFVLPASRLAEFEQVMPENESKPWRLSVLLGPKIEDDIAALDEFAPRCSKLAIVDCVETKVAFADDVEKAHRLIGTATTTYYETPITEKLPELLDTIKRVNGRAKIRTGGVTPDAFPSSEAVASFLIECARRELPFKATAGLHHPVRCLRPLTYEASARTGTMHGFLNVFMAAASLAAVVARLPRKSDQAKTRLQQFTMLIGCKSPVLEFTNEIASILAEGEPRRVPATTGFTGHPQYPHGMAQFAVPMPHIRAARLQFAISFGSCSFEEPIADLKSLNLL
jgi:hypothetical protein